MQPCKKYPCVCTCTMELSYKYWTPLIIDTSPDLIRQVYMSTFQGCSSFVYLLRLCSWDHAIYEQCVLHDYGRCPRFRDTEPLLLYYYTIDGILLLYADSEIIGADWLVEMDCSMSDSLIFSYIDSRTDSLITNLRNLEAMEVRVECYPDHGAAGGSDQVLGACNRQYSSMQVPAIFFFLSVWYTMVSSCCLSHHHFRSQFIS